MHSETVLVAGRGPACAPCAGGASARSSQLGLHAATK